MAGWLAGWIACIFHPLLTAPFTSHLHTLINYWDSQPANQPTSQPVSVGNVARRPPRPPPFLSSPIVSPPAFHPSPSSETKKFYLPFRGREEGSRDPFVSFFFASACPTRIHLDTPGKGKGREGKERRDGDGSDWSNSHTPSLNDCTSHRPLCFFLLSCFLSAPAAAAAAVVVVVVGIVVVAAMSLSRVRVDLASGIV